MPDPGALPHRARCGVVILRNRPSTVLPAGNVPSTSATRIGVSVRKFLAAALIGVGVFGLVLAGMLRFWAPSHAKKTPLNLNITQVATGEAQVLNGQTGKAETFQLRATRIVRTDSTASDSKYTTVNESLCVVKVIGDTPGCVDAHDPQNRLVSLTTDRAPA